LFKIENNTEVFDAYLYFEARVNERLVAG